MIPKTAAQSLIMAIDRYIAKADQDFRDCGITPVTVPVRGGTDGARLSFRGLPCPNLSTGGQNYHGIYEYLNLSSLQKMPAVLVRIAELFVGCRK